MKIVLLFSAFLGAASYAQTPLFSKFELKYEYSSATVNTLFKDHNGFLWIGTSVGLLKTDGSTFTSILSASNENRPNITAIAEDKEKKIWVGARDGTIGYVKGNKIISDEFKNNFPNKGINSITCDRKGVIWFTTKGDGVFYLLKKKLIHIDFNEGLTDNYCYQAREDNSGNIWIGTDQGITVCRTDSGIKKIVRVITSRDGLPDDIVRDIVCLDDGNVMIGLQDKGVCFYNLNTGLLEVPEKYNHWKYGQINNIIHLGDECWLTTQTSGLVYDNGKKNIPLKNFSAFENLKFYVTSSAIADNENNIWFIYDGGILRTTGSKLQLLQSPDLSPINFVHSVYYDSNDKLWFTPDQGLVSLGMNDTLKKNIKKYAITTPAEMEDIVALYEDLCGYIWIGTTAKGVFRLNPETGVVTKIFTDSSLSNATVLSITGRGDELWLASLGGVRKFKIPEDCWQNNIRLIPVEFDKEKRLGEYYIYSVFIDSRNRAWIGTDGKGLLKTENNVLTFYDNSKELKSNIIYSITEDFLGNIWFSTADAGIYKFSGNKFENISDSAGLIDNTVTSIFPDTKGDIIAIHKNGIDIIDAKTLSVISYGKEWGLDNINADLNAFTLDGKGKCYIGTEKGIFIYNSEMQPEHRFPKTVITSVSAFLNPVDFINLNEFRYSQNNITFEFTGLWLDNSDRVQYRYKLDGYTKDWIYTLDKKINFPALPPGKYIFKVASSLNGDFNNALEVPYLFTIRKPFWKEYWFIALVLLILFLVFYIYINAREKELGKMEELKNEKVQFQFETLRSQVNPHFLFNSFNTLISIIEDDKNHAIEYVEKLSDFFRNIVTIRDKEVIELKDELEIASTYFFLQQKRYGNNFTWKVNVSENDLQLKVPPMVLQILIENAVKHNAISKDTPLHVEIFSLQNKLHVKNKINKKMHVEASTKTGLQNISNRYKLLTKEEIEIKKDENYFEISLPLLTA